MNPNDDQFVKFVHKYHNSETTEKIKRIRVREQGVILFLWILAGDSIYIIQRHKSKNNPSEGLTWVLEIFRKH